MNREDKMMIHFESVTNIRYTKTNRAVKVADAIVKKLKGE
jgi:hypothetical protein